METFREPTPEEAKLIALQFMGQAVTGEMKEIDKNIVNRTNQLNGNNLNIKNILNSIAPSAPQPQVAAPVRTDSSNLQYMADTRRATVVAASDSSIFDKINSNLEKIIKLLEK
jgi:hypothetical protein